MKLKTILPLITALCALHSPLCMAQEATNLPPLTPQNFLTAAENYFTIQTNYSTFNHNRGAAWTGAAYVQNQLFANVIGLEYNLGTNSNFYLQSITANAGVAGTVVSEQANLGWHIVRQYNLDFSVGAGAGDNLNLNQPFGDVFAQVLDATGQTTFAGIRLEEDFTGHKLGAPPFYLMVGFKF